MACMVGEWFSMHNGLIIFQSVSKNISLQLKEELKPRCGIRSGLTVRLCSTANGSHIATNDKENAVALRPMFTSSCRCSSWGSIPVQGQQPSISVPRHPCRVSQERRRQLGFTTCTKFPIACCVQQKPSTFDGAMCKLLMYPCQRVTEKTHVLTRKHHRCWRLTVPLLGSAVPAETFVTRHDRGDPGSRARAIHHVVPVSFVSYVAPATTVLVAPLFVIERPTPATRALLHQRQSPSTSRVLSSSVAGVGLSRCRLLSPHVVLPDGPGR